MAVPAASSEELPLLIQDYSCANSFEEHVRSVEKIIASLFDTEPLLQSFLVPSASLVKPSRASSSLSAKDVGTMSSPTSDGCVSDIDDDTSSLVSLLDDVESGNSKSRNASLSNVFTQTLTLYAQPSPDAERPPQLNVELSLAVEVHVRDVAHLITQQYCTPLFFLIRKVTASASYRESETNYLLSLLSTAVRQMLRRQKNNAVLRIGSATPTAAPATTAPHHTRATTMAADALPSPFFFPDGCAPCFAPAGDSYKQSFVGLSPPLPTVGVLPQLASSPAGVSTAEWCLLHRRTFTTRFLSDAFAKPPEHCRTLSDFIDLFQLHVGQHSRIRSDDFEGICVSLWEEYALPIPWKFHPHGPPPPDTTKAGKKSRSDRAREELPINTPAFTWDEVMKRENKYTQLLSGAFTHAFGTAAPPLKHVLFRFQWSQLQDVEAHEPNGRGGHLDPFQFTPSSLSPTLTTAAQAAQRKCCITARAVVRNDDHVEGGVRQRLHDIVERSFLDPLAHGPVHVPSSHRTRTPKRGSGVDDSGDDTQAPSTTAKRPARQGRNARTAAESESVDVDSEEAPLLELAAHIVEWTGSNVHRHASLLRRFARPCSEDSEDGGWPQDVADDEGQEGRTCGGVLAATGRRSGTVVARRLRSLWGVWVAHQQLFPDTSGTGQGGNPSRGDDGSWAEDAPVQALEGTATTTTLSSGKDLRADYFPESFFARFAYACATQLTRAEDVLTLWRLCLDRLRRLLLFMPSGSDKEKEEEQKRGWQRLLDCLALPRADPPVDLNQPVISQKLRVLRFALSSLLHPGETLEVSAGGGNTGCPPMTDTAREGTSSLPLRLITNGELLIVPAPLPSPPTTSDEVLRRAMELNALGASVVHAAPATWLQSDALYNDMCLFLHANKAQDGRVVRFPDFVHWHSPRDFISPPPSSSPAVVEHCDGDYLSDRMKNQPDGERGSSHVWWSLWDRAVPRSREDILRTLFRPLDEAIRILDWLAALPESTLLLEVSNACVSNALHQLLCHRFLLGDAPERDVKVSRAGVTACSAPGNSHIPSSPRLRALHAYTQEKCTSLTKDLEAASAILSSRADAAIGGTSSSTSKQETPSFLQGPSAMEVMELEMVRTFVANALRELGEIEVGLCTAVAVHYLLGFSADADAATTVRALCAPLPPAQASQQNASESLLTRTVTISRATWSTHFAKQFFRPESRAVQERMVRLTCMAERPLNTCGCFQQLVVHRDTTDTLRMALALTKEVL